jgi:hypothetical protein
LTTVVPPEATEVLARRGVPELALELLGEVTGVCGEPSRLKVVSGGKRGVLTCYRRARPHLRKKMNAPWFFSKALPMEHEIIRGEHPVRLKGS